jgi:diadenosine tetraphosphate (Ap4A) HIT family hydrolase
VKNLTDKPCELCNSQGGAILWQGPLCRVVLAEAGDYPGYCRVILSEHVKEMTDLAPPERIRIMNTVFAAEAALRELARPDKVNLASLGNLVAHLHWHVIPRWREDRHLPGTLWSAPARDGQAPRAPDPAQLAARLKALLA